MWVEVLALATILTAGALGVGTGMRSEYEAILGLRVLGAAQLAYAETNLEKNYGSFPALHGSGRINSELKRAEFTPHYQLGIFFAESWGCSDGRFTIVAIPRAPISRLRTFALCDDQTVRVATDFALHQPYTSDRAVPVGDDPCNWDRLAEEDLIRALDLSDAPAIAEQFKPDSP